MYNSRKIITLLCCIVVGTNAGSLIAQNVTDYDFPKHRTHICGVPHLTPEVIASLNKKTEKKYPLFAKNGLPNAVLGKTSADLTVGDQLNFWAVDFTDGSRYPATAELRKEGSFVNIWVEVAQLTNGKVTPEFVDELFELFENTTSANSIDPNKGMVAIEREMFGDEPNIDGDGVTDIFLLNIRDSFSPGGSNVFFAGYFDPNDQVNGTMTNLRDIVYLDIDPSIQNNFVLKTAAHEYQHLIHYTYSAGEESELIDEGASQLAQAITGVGWDDPGIYLSNTDRSLIFWDEETNPLVLADYRKAQLWMIYLWEQFGATFIKNLVQDPAEGITSLINNINNSGSGLSFPEVLQNWFIANYVNDKSINPVYGYDYFEAQNMKASVSFNEFNYPAILSGRPITEYSPEYVRFTRGENLSGSYTGSSVSASAVKVIEGTAEVVDLTSGGTFTDATFGIDHSELIVVFMNSSGGENSYSYNFQAEQPFFVLEAGYDDGVADVLVNGIPAIWHGIDTPGSGFAVKYSPLNDASYLLGVRANVFIDTTFMGSPNFKLHILDDSGIGGEPGSDIIEPQDFKVPHGVDLEWVEVDLGEFSDVLEQYRGDFYIAILHPENDTNFFLLGVDNSRPEVNGSWSLFGPNRANPGWSRFEEITLGGVSAGSYNGMIHAQMSFLDTDEPNLTGGYLQNPVFSENFDIFIVGDKALNTSTLEGTITVNDVTTPLQLNAIDEFEDVFVDNSISITESGTVTLNFSGTNRFGKIEGETTLSFSVQSVNPGVRGKISSISGVASLLISGNELAKRTSFTAFEGLHYSIDETRIVESFGQENEALGEILTFGPTGLQNGDFEVRINFSGLLDEGKSPGMLYIARYENGRWSPLNSTVDEAEHIVVAKTNKLGTFHLFYGENVRVPDSYELKQNFPNPFNPQTKITFSLVEEEFVTLEIYDLLGQKIRTLVSRQMQGGFHEVTWDSRNDFGNAVASGIYLYRIKAGNFTDTKKMVLIR